MGKVRTLGAAVCAIFVGGCGPSWDSVKEEHGPAMARIRQGLLAAKAAIDAKPAASAYPVCVPNPAFKNAPQGTAAEHNTDFIVYEHIASGGYYSKRLRGAPLLWATPLSKALFWTHPSAEFGDDTDFDIMRHDGFPEKRPTEAHVAKVARATGVKHVVIVREAADSKPQLVKGDSFLVTLEPTTIVCAFSLEGPAGEMKGEAAKTYVEQTIVKKTGKVISERTVTEGGYYQGSAEHEANHKYAELSMKHHGFAPKQD